MIAPTVEAGWDLAAFDQTVLTTTLYISPKQPETKAVKA